MVDIKLPQGVRTRDGKVKIATVFDADVFDDICALARHNRVTFSEAANDAAKCGIFDLREAKEMPS